MKLIFSAVALRYTSVSCDVRKLGLHTRPRVPGSASELDQFEVRSGEEEQCPSY